MKGEITLFEERIIDTKLRKMFHNCFYNSLDTTVEYLPNEEVYMLTGDIPAMWLRDSSASVIQYIDFAKDDKDVYNLIKGLIKRQFFYIEVDPYANSFNKEPNGHGHKDDEGLRTPYTWERKFEIDSLCYPVWLLYRLYKVTGDKSLLSPRFVKIANIIMDTFITEQHHHERSSYMHYRPGEKEGFNIPNHGKGGEVAYTGMIWSGYRPSDDACKYGYFVPGNMFAVVILRELEELFLEINEKELALKAKTLKEEIDEGIEKYGIINHPEFGDIYAFEVDGLGNYLLMDDANVPSLLSIPYFGYADATDPIYKNTRNYCLSFSNPYYFEGKCLKGIGSPHTDEGYVWHIGVTLQALTSSSEKEKKELIEMVKRSDADTNYTHEGVDKDNPNNYTRSWFAWSNSLFAYLLLQEKDLIIGEKA